MIYVMLSHGYFTQYLCFLSAGLFVFFLSRSSAWVSLWGALSRVRSCALLMEVCMQEDALPLC